MHDRRIDGVPHTFGNYGALFMSAMTWFDHETNSVWSQPWGRAIDGEYRGVELFVLPSRVTTWASWREANPNTLAMINDVDRLSFGRRQSFNPDFVLGLLLSGEAMAFYYEDVAAEGLVNDELAGLPIIVWAGETSLNAYVRQVGDQVLTFEIQGDQILDQETGSRWNLARGLAVDGPLRGEALQGVPGTSSWDWAWRDFYPNSEFYSP
ncbi:MAG: hypothetical protein BMS9Abin28_1069 [Anaerolineae bacterium]|nr:MAG: hypothetical protein BMS9Abin28_1069 [Anaerolineae bacterium]